MTRFCFIGASTTEGLGDTERKGWVGRLARTFALSDAVFNLGVRGQTIFEVAERAEAECRARLPQPSDGRIVVGAPLNEHARLEDGSPRASRADIMHCYHALLTKLAAIAPVALVGPPPIDASRMPFRSVASGLTLMFDNAEIDSVDTELAEICRRDSVPYLGVFTHLANNEAYLAGLRRNDGLHTDAAGYGAFANYISENAEWRDFLQG